MEHGKIKCVKILRNTVDNLKKNSLRYANGKELCVKYKKSVYQSLVLITQFGINMIVPIFLCTGLGIFIDKKSGLGFFIIPLFILGALAGFRNCYIVAKKIYESDDKKHDKET